MNTVRPSIGESTGQSGLPASSVVLAPVLFLFLAACQPTVKVEAPSEPITINLNIKLDADVRLRLEEEAEQDIDENPDIF